MQKVRKKSVPTFEEKIKAMGFLIYDLVFLAVFLIFFSLFLYTRKKNVDKEGLLLLYRTKWGIKLIDKIGKKYKKTLKVLSYVSVITGYFLMVGIFYVVYTIIKVYFFSPAIVRAIKVPPILPLVPYLPQIFSLDFLPPFYFTYWIVIIAIIAISHEFAHGVFMRRYNIKIKSTGFGFFPFFLPIFLAAFVEQDEKSMNKAKKFEQMAVLSAGTFANVIVAILFFIVLFLFFSVAFTPSGVIFDTYATSEIAIAGISAMNGAILTNPSYDQIMDLAEEEGFNEIEFEGEDYLISKEILEQQEGNEGILVVYYDAPAVRNELESTIIEINEVQVISVDELVEELSKYSPGEEISIKTKTEDGFIVRDMVLEEHPAKPQDSWLGIGFYDTTRSGFFGKIINSLSSFKKPHIYYAPQWGEFSLFIYHLLWWLVLIAISVALINMLPMGIFDGGKFFYLTVLAWTGNKKWAEKSFKFLTQFFLFVLFLLLVLWAISWF